MHSWKAVHNMFSWEQEAKYYSVMIKRLVFHLSLKVTFFQSTTYTLIQTIEWIKTIIKLEGRGIYEIHKSNQWRTVGSRKQPLGL